MDGLVDELADGARAEMAIVAEHGGAVEAVHYMKTQLVESHRARVGADRARRAEGDRPERVHRARALAAPGGRGRRDPDRRPAVEQGQIDAVRAWRSERDQAAVDAALEELRAAAASRT